jgi:hypothetical protein
MQDAVTLLFNGAATEEHAALLAQVVDFRLQRRLHFRHLLRQLTQCEPQMIGFEKFFMQKRFQVERGSPPVHEVRNRPTDSTRFVVMSCVSFITAVGESLSRCTRVEPCGGCRSHRWQ